MDYPIKGSETARLSNYTLRKRFGPLCLQALLFAGVLLLAAATIAAQSGGGYDLSWNTVDGGGGSSSGGTYTLSGTVGQPDAGLLTGGAYRLAGGFWGGGAIAMEHRIYLPLVLRN